MSRFYFVLLFIPIMASALANPLPVPSKILDAGALVLSENIISKGSTVTFTVVDAQDRFEANIHTTKSVDPVEPGDTKIYFSEKGKTMIYSMNRDGNLLVELDKKLCVSCVTTKGNTTLLFNDGTNLRMVVSPPKKKSYQ